MKHLSLGLVVVLLFLSAHVARVKAQQPVEKTNPMKVYMHYMPWFETPATIVTWGWHWTMNNQNPDIIEANGQRQIASHYYPLIGPYASRDKDVIEYHLLLMKLSGIDGVLINWYGVLGSNGDINNLLQSSNAIINQTDQFGMQFGVVMEDRFSRSMDDVKANLGYLQNNYFTKSAYIRHGADSVPLVCIFGPITFEQPSQWTEMLPSAGNDVEFITLWYESSDAGENADGEFAWVYQNDVDHLTHLTNFYTSRAPQLKTAIGSAYPGFNDFYAEGGAGEGYFNIPHYFGSTLDATLDKATEYKDNMDMLQLVTFNDFGEGTIFEPTVETGFNYLHRVQQYTGVSYGEAELKLVYRLYLLRKDYASDSQIQDSLNLASAHLNNLEIDAAAQILNAIPLLSSLNKNQPVYDSGSGLKISPNPLKGNTLNLELPQNLLENTPVTIFDATGKAWHSEWLEKGFSSYSFLIPPLPAGLYFLKLQLPKSTRSTRFLIQL